MLSGVSVCACGDGELAGRRWPSLPEPLLGRVRVSAAWRGLTAAQCPAGRLSARCGRPAACSWRPCSAEVSGGGRGVVAIALGLSWVKPFKLAVRFPPRLRVG